jgi:hypothetical protein
VTLVFDVCGDSLHVLELPGLDESSRDLGQRPLQEVCDVGGDSLRVLELPGSGACIRDAGQTLVSGRLRSPEGYEPNRSA